MRGACLFTCTHVVKDETGKITEIHGTYDERSEGGNAWDGRKIKGTLHWVSVAHAVPLEVRLYDRLFTVPAPDGDPVHPFTDFLNPDSLRVVTAYGEAALADARPDTPYQFERVGYFCLDPDSTAEKPVFNRTVTLKDTWAKVAAKA